MLVVVVGGLGWMVVVGELLVVVVSLFVVV